MRVTIAARHPRYHAGRAISTWPIGNDEREWKQVTLFRQSCGLAPQRLRIVEHRRWQSAAVAALAPEEMAHGRGLGRGQAHDDGAIGFEALVLPGDDGGLSHLEFGGQQLQAALQEVVRGRRLRKATEGDLPQPGRRPRQRSGCSDQPGRRPRRAAAAARLSASFIWPMGQRCAARAPSAAKPLSSSMRMPPKRWSLVRPPSSTPITRLPSRSAEATRL